MNILWRKLKNNLQLPEINKFMEITAKKEGEGIVLEMCDSPMPIQGEYGGSEDAREEYEEDFKVWQASKKVVRVHPDSEFEMMEIICASFNFRKSRTKPYSYMLCKFLEKGIPCNELKDRIEMVRQHPGEGKGYSDNAEWIYWVILKPLPLPMEESQEEMIKELIDIIDLASQNSEGYGTAIKAIKSNFKLTRNK